MHAKYDNSETSYLFKQAIEENFKWGTYAFKPVPQKQFDSLVAKAASEAAKVDVMAEVAATSGQFDVRPRIYDRGLKQWLLLW